MSKDLSLLRPFDREKAKQGEPICYSDGTLYPIYRYGPDNRNFIAYERDNQLYTADTKTFRMTPLCWIEDKPVYKGDTLYHCSCGKVIITGLNQSGCGGDLRSNTQFGNAATASTNLSWTKPKQKKQGWINVYPNEQGYWYETEAIADAKADTNRIACVPFEYEVD